MEVSTPIDASNERSARAVPQLRAVLLCDLVDSTALIERVGDAAAAALMRRHDRLARDLMHAHDGHEIDKTDGFLILFERAVQAVAFGLAYQRALRELARAEDQPLQARVGIHVGEVVLWDNVAADIADGAKPVEVEGLTKPVAARLMGLARPGQILLSEMARTLAQRAHQELPESANVRWLGHGRYRFKGVPQPMMIHEVGEVGIAPLSPPPSGSKSQRELPWWRRPAALALEVLLLLTAISIPVYLSLRTQPAIAFAERDWVVLGDLRNLTTESIFDDALDEAFRIGLEQSRYVNVIPELQLRTALQRMQLESGTSIDRNVAIELALREGARAVILPTVAEVGGRVRISAEIIDPNSGVTVFGESADGQGAEAALPAMDRVLEGVRARLGESLASIEDNSAPLEKVTTDNLDALRAYSIGVRSIYDGDLDQALRLLQQATELDPGFASAYAKRAQTLYGLGRIAEAKRFSALALEHRDRLPAREQLYVDAARMIGEPVDAAIEKWDLLSSMYPDFAAGPHNVGMYQWQLANRFVEADRAFAQAILTRSPLLFASHSYRGYAQLGMEQAAAAEASFREALALSPNPVAFGLADALGAQGRFAEADASLADVPSGLSPFFAVHRHQRRISNLVAQHRYGEALDALDDAKRLIGSAGMVAAQRRLALIGMQLLELDGRRDELAAALDAALPEFLAEAGAASDYDVWLMRALLSYLAARNDALPVARRALAAAQPPDDAPDDFFRDRFLHVAAAQLALAEGDADAAVNLLQPLLDGREPVQAHVVLARAFRAQADSERLAAELSWLASHGGRAYAEFTAQWAMQPLNVDAHRRAAAERAAAAP